MAERAGMARVSDPAVFGKVCVLMGGWSAEREVSLKSGAAVLQALRERGIDAHGIDAGRDVMSRLADGGYARVFIAMHGRGGEDGVIQGALEALGLPYTGSGVLGSALAMDKLRTKQLWLSMDLPTPAFRVLSEDSDFAGVVRDLGLPLMVKPANEGSSLGMTKVQRAEDLPRAWETARQLDRRVFAERWIVGAEYTSSVLGERVLPFIRVETPREFYDYTAKYFSDDTRYHCPCGLDAAQEAELARLTRRAFDAIGCSGWGRVDLLCDRAGNPWLIEVNTVPGMTDHSLVPMAARAAGIAFTDLVWRILEETLDRPMSRRMAP